MGGGAINCYCGAVAHQALMFFLLFSVENIIVSTNSPGVIVVYYSGPTRATVIVSKMVILDSARPISSARNKQFSPHCYTHILNKANYKQI